MELTAENMKASLAYAKQRQESDRRWSTIYWCLHNTCIGTGLISQLIVIFGLALMTYFPEPSRASANVVLLSISFVGLAFTVLDLVIGFSRKSRLLARTADTIELSLALHNDRKMSDDEFGECLKKIVSLRQQQHDD